MPEPKPQIICFLTPFQEDVSEYTGLISPEKNKTSLHTGKISTIVITNLDCDSWRTLTRVSDIVNKIGLSETNGSDMIVISHDDVIKWKHFPRYWPVVWGIHRSPVNSPHKGQWRGALMFSLILARINSWVNNGEAGDLRRLRSHCDVIVMFNIEMCFTVGSFALGLLLESNEGSNVCGPMTLYGVLHLC